VRRGWGERASKRQISKAAHEEKRRKKRGGRRKMRVWSPHPNPLPADWEREEEKTRCAEDGGSGHPAQDI